MEGERSDEGKLCNNFDSITSGITTNEETARNDMWLAEDFPPQFFIERGDGTFSVILNKLQRRPAWMPLAFLSREDAEEAGLVELFEAVPTAQELEVYEANVDQTRAGTNSLIFTSGEAQALSMNQGIPILTNDFAPSQIPIDAVHNNDREYNLSNTNEPQLPHIPGQSSEPSESWCATADVWSRLASGPEAPATFHSGNVQHDPLNGATQAGSSSFQVLSPAEADLPSPIDLQQEIDELESWVWGDSGGAGNNEREPSLVIRCRKNGKVREDGM